MHLLLSFYLSQAEFIIYDKISILFSIKTPNINMEDIDWMVLITK